MIQACAKFDVTIAPIPESPDRRYRVSVILIDRIQYAVKDVYTMTILAVVRISTLTNAD